MYWLYSIFIAGLMFSNEGKLPFQVDFNYAETNATQSVKLDETDRFEQTYPLNANGKVSVSNVNGSIKIEAWDRQEVKIEAIKIADSREHLSDFSVKIDSQSDYLNVETQYEKQNNKQYGGNYRTEVQYRLTVPRTAVLDEIETVNGEISVSNTVNITKASAVNGKVIGINLQGTAKLSTVNGTVEADFDRLQKTSKISLDTVNGTVNLIIPSDASATVKADTVNGRINNDFGLPVRTGKYVGKDLYGKIGDGDVQIKLSSVNGGLSVKRKNDGKNLNPATNLLPAKNSDEDDRNADGEGENFPVARQPKPPAVPQTPLPPNFEGLINDAEIQKNVDEALKEAQKEIGKITPEMQKQIEEGLRKAHISTKEMQEQIKLAREKYKEAATQMSNANWFNGSPVIEKKSESYTVTGTPKITVNAEKCSVIIRGWEKSEVQYSATKIGRSSNQIPTDIQANQSGANVNITVSDNDKNRPDSEVNNIRLEIFVPKKANLKITTDGEIRLEGVSGEIELNGEDGTINVRDSDGKIQIVSDDGAIRVIGFKGEINTKNVGGITFLEGDFKNLVASSEDGSIIVTLPENADVRLMTNREITNEGLNLTKEKENSWRIGKGSANFRMQTTDGEIFLRRADALKTLQE